MSSACMGFFSQSFRFDIVCSTHSRVGAINYIDRYFVSIFNLKLEYIGRQLNVHFICLRNEFPVEASIVFELAFLKYSISISAAM